MIFISLGCQNLGVEFARALAAKLGYECVSRDELLEAATRRRIPIGKLETSIVKPHIHYERLAVELEHYKALSTSILCAKALDHPIVYYGRTGHLLFPGIDHLLRIRVVSDMEQRIETVMSKLDLPRNKARRYIDAVEEDRRKWVKNFYNVDWDAFNLYDLVLNLSQVNVGNAASVVCSMAQLPEFQPTPASMRALKDLWLASRAQLSLADDPATADVAVKVTASTGVVYVTYSFLQAKKAQAIADVLRDLPGASRVVCTEAQTNLLWIQEAFEPEGESCAEVLSLANRWDAAVEIIRVTPGEDAPRWKVDTDVATRGLETWRQTGIIDEHEDEAAPEPEDLSRTYERLMTAGRAGGKRMVSGSLKSLLGTIDRSVQYRLVVLDNVFLSKSPEARMRMSQEWRNSLAESMKAPVVSLSEIRRKYRFGARQALQLMMASALTALIVFVAFLFENQIVSLLLREGTTARVLCTVCIVLFVPTFAFIYSAATGRFLRMIGLD